MRFVTKKVGLFSSNRNWIQCETSFVLLKLTWTLLMLRRPLIDPRLVSYNAKHTVGKLGGRVLRRVAWIYVHWLSKLRISQSSDWIRDLRPRLLLSLTWLNAS